MRGSKSYVRPSITEGMVRLSDISSPTLVCAKEFYDKEGIKKKLEEDEISVLENILKANGFDAIPLVDDKGMITRVARRRYHDGDTEDIFIIQADEVEELLFKDDGDSNILDTIFFVISSEHHIALTGPSLHKENCRIVTLDTLANESVRRYLDHKVADISSSSEPIDAHLSRDIFNGILGQAKKARSPGSEVSDLEFTKHAVRLLESMQPLKNSMATASDKELVPIGEVWHLSGEGGPIAEEIAVWPMWGVLQDKKKGITKSALNSLSSANAFDHLLVYKDGSEGVFRVRRRKGAGWREAGFEVLEEIASLDEVIASMKEAADDTPGKKGPVPAVIIRGENKHPKEYGIITQEEMLRPPVMHELLTRLVVLENDIKDYLLDHEMKELKIGKRGIRRNVKTLSLAPLIDNREQVGEMHFGLLKMEIKRLGDFRSDLVHELYAKKRGLDINTCNSAMAAERKIRAKLDS